MATTQGQEQLPHEEPRDDQQFSEDEIDDIFTDPEHEGGAALRAGDRRPATNVSAFIDDQTSDLSRHAGKLKLTDALAGQQPADDREKDKGARATSEQVLDNRTRMLLLRTINKGVVSEIYGCVSTGKEANVYHAVVELPEGQGIAHRAIKVYKTSILSFKARSKYVEGDFRFQSGYNKSSSRAMVKQWAEKEMRNLRRIHTAGIPCPEPIYLRYHVLVMGFLGDRKGIAAPRLKDVQLEGDDVDEHWQSIYTQVLGYVRTLFNECRLVHADLSEYNIMFHDDKPFIIDVSQSVEHDHPESLNFLRSDIKNVTDFFRRQSVNVLSERRVFDYVTAREEQPDPTDLLNQPDAVSTDTAAADGGVDCLTSAVDVEVFRNQYIPRNLQEIDDVEKQDAAVYQDLLAREPDRSADSEGSGDAAHFASSDGEGSSGQSRQERGDRIPRGKRFVNKDEKRAHKHLVKEEKRDKRRTKMPKHVKKKLVKDSARKH